MPMLQSYLRDLPAADHVSNGSCEHGGYPDRLRKILSVDDFSDASRVISAWPGYSPTPLCSLAGIADEIGIAEILYKDEAHRFGLGSFKALGGAYAVMMLLCQELGARLKRTVSTADIHSGDLARESQNITVATATDGNHGRSVAWGAQRFGCRCRIYVHEHVSERRKRAIEDLGAKVVQIEGGYDQSVHQLASDAETNGWFVVSDTSYEGYTHIPRWVMSGYGLMVEEITHALVESEPPTHCFVQGGVGGLAASLCAGFWQRWGERTPRMLVVEPDKAACLMNSALQAEPVKVSITEETIMAGLSCGEVSLLAWDVVLAGVTDFLTIDDDWIPPTMRLLAEGIGGDVPLVAGETGVAGLSALLAVSKDPGLRSTIKLTPQSRVLVIGTEGATDPDIYKELVGGPPEAII